MAVNIHWWAETKTKTKHHATALNQDILIRFSANIHSHPNIYNGKTMENDLDDDTDSNLEKKAVVIKWELIVV